MCIAVLALDAHPDYPLVLMHNRDEFHARAAQPLHRWPENPSWMAGRDLETNGMWAVFTDRGDFGFVTNYRDPARHRTDRKSRGEILPGILERGETPKVAVARIAREARLYNPFNLVVGRYSVAGDDAGRASGEAYFLNSVDAAPVPLGKGVHAVSNARLETPWPKLVRARRLFGEATAGRPTRAELEVRLFTALFDDVPAPDAELPETGLSKERERLVSPIFIRSANYGTVASLVAIADREGRLSLAESRFGPDGTLSHKSLASVLARP